MGVSACPFKPPYLMPQISEWSWSFFAGWTLWISYELPSRKRLSFSTTQENMRKFHANLSFPQGIKKQVLCWMSIQIIYIKLNYKPLFFSYFDPEPKIFFFLITKNTISKTTGSSSESSHPIQDDPALPGAGASEVSGLAPAVSGQVDPRCWGGKMLKTTDDPQKNSRTLVFFFSDFCQFFFPVEQWLGM